MTSSHGQPKAAPTPTAPELPGAHPAERIHCSAQEALALRKLASSRTAGIWRIKRAKVILGIHEGESPSQLMGEVRVPVLTIIKFANTFAELGMQAFAHPSRKPTAREARVEQMLALLEEPPPARSPLWATTTVRYIGRDYTAEEILHLRNLIADAGESPRAELARHLCRLVGLYDGNGGKLRIANATNVLERMAMDNLVALPPLRKRARNKPRTFLGRLPSPTLRESVGGPLRFCLVAGEEDSQLWRELLRRHHYIDNTRLFGAQLRYLVYATDNPTQTVGAGAPRPDTDNLVAVLGFAAAAWKLRDRDAFIGWTDKQRSRNLKLVVGNARFLILPWVRAKNLASRILGGVARKLPLDWEQRYGYRPALLETFVQLDRFHGTCYKAANWICIGATRGYSLHGRKHRDSAPKRAVFLYPLHKNFRRVLCGGPPRSNPGRKL